MSVAFIDIETTGLHPDDDLIWEIAAIVDDVEHCWLQRLPGHGNWRDTVDPWVLENTRITEVYDPREALTRRASIDRFVDLTRGRHLVGAVPSFDSERLHRLYRRTRSDGEPWTMPWHYHLIDVEALTVGYLAALGEPVELPWSSHDLTRRIGVETPVEDEHTALGDARWAKAVYEKIVGRP